MDKLLEKCPACESVLRPNAVFCHHCGRPLLSADLHPPVLETQNLSAENLLAADEETVLAKTPASVKNIVPAATSEKLENTNGAATITQSVVTVIETVPSGRETTSEKNASELSSSSKPRTNRYVSRTEYVWEEAAAPTWRIILFSFLAVLLVALLFLFNSSLR